MGTFIAKEEATQQQIVTSLAYPDQSCCFNQGILPQLVVYVSMLRLGLFRTV